MKRLFSPRFVGFAVLVCAFLVSGCGKESAKLTPVAGKVTLNNQPVTAGQVSLFSLEKEGKAAGLMTGKIDSSGGYKILTDNRDGAPLGKYRVTVTPSMVPATDGQKGPMGTIPPQYMDSQKSQLTIEVVENPEPGRYDLKMSK
ncbi:MAG TPA: hypothetical protein VH575_36405 [Gemmataceae bacterium]